MSRQGIAIVVVAVLFTQFVVVLVASLVRAQRGRAPSVAGATAPSPELIRQDRRPSPVTRREFFRRSLLGSFGVFGAQFGVASLAFLWPNLQGAFGSVIDLGISADEIKAQIRGSRLPFYFGAGRFYLVEHDGDGADDVYEGLVTDGLMALFQRCVHLGCRVPFCEQSQYFECPCHGSKYNRAGEFWEGPAPRGLDRFAVSVEDGTVRVDTSKIVLGPVHGTDTTGQTPGGQWCVDVGEA